MQCKFCPATATKEWYFGVTTLPLCIRCERDLLKAAHLQELLVRTWNKRLNPISKAHEPRAAGHSINSISAQLGYSATAIVRALKKSVPSPTPTPTPTPDELEF